ncbi:MULTISPECIES: MFS transporter [Brevibacillus]|uniref:MFS transporter n=1 Tax=Brevibacillus TaxID=55080 RepID=UPI0004022ADF|nr:MULTISPECIES: MFS transporter [Brevibacillus]QHZ56644.1 multidrug efflux MFS transporter [Brevibacillus sp. NSP2.1]WHX28267.1 MFS transporter [Brevibacillus agri]
MSSATSFARSFRILWAGQFFSTCSLTIIVPLLPFYMAELGATLPEANRIWTGVALAAPAVTMCLFSPLWGRYGDQVGKKWMVVRALAGISISLLWMGLASSPLVFVLARLLQGAFGGVVDAAAAFAGAQASEGTKGRALGNLQSATAAGSLTGPLIGGLLSDWFGLATMILWSALFTALCSVAAAVVLQEPASGRNLESREKLPIAHASQEMLRHPRIRNMLVAGMLAQFGVYGLVAIFAPHVEGIVGSAYAASWVGVLQAVTWSATFLAAPWWGRRNDRKRIEKNVCVALLGCGVSIVLQTWPADVIWLLPLRALQGFCFAALVQSIFLVVTLESAENRRGVYIGLANSTLTIGQIIGSLLGAGFGALLPLEWAFAAMGLAFLSAAGWLALTAPRQRLAHAALPYHPKEVKNE